MRYVTTVKNVHEHGLLGFNQFDMRGSSHFLAGPTSGGMEPQQSYHWIKAQYLEASIRNEQGPSSPPTGRRCTSAKYTLAAGKLTGRSSRENLSDAPEVGELELTQFLLQNAPSPYILILTLAAQRVNRTLPTPQHFVFRERISEPRKCVLKTLHNAHFAARR